MAQLAGRASGELYTLIFFRDKDVVEDAMVTTVKSNGIGVMVPKYGIESTIILWRETEVEEGKPQKPNPFKYDEENLTLSGNGSTFKIFDKLKVRIFVQTSKMRRQWLVLEVVDADNNPLAGTVKQIARASLKNKKEETPSTKRKKSNSGKQTKAKKKR